MSSASKVDNSLDFVIKNTFLHFKDTEDRPITKRSKSAPPALPTSGVSKMSSLTTPASEPEEDGFERSNSAPPLLTRDQHRRVSIASSVTTQASHSDVVSTKQSRDSARVRVLDKQLLSRHVETGQSEKETGLTITMPTGIVPECANCEVLTVMVKNIPVACTAEEICRAIGLVGFEGQYNYFFMPLRRTPRGDVNMGYAFVGFPNPRTTKQFAERMTGVRLAPSGKTAKCVSVLPAKVQGSTNVSVCA